MLVDHEELKKFDLHLPKFIIDTVDFHLYFPDYYNYRSLCRREIDKKVIEDEQLMEPWMTNIYLKDTVIVEDISYAVLILNLPEFKDKKIGFNTRLSLFNDPNRYRMLFKVVAISGVFPTVYPIGGSEGFSWSVPANDVVIINEFGDLLCISSRRLRRTKLSW